MASTTTNEIEIDVLGECLTLRGDGTIYVAAWDALLVADLHLGKDASFRAGGVPVPEGMNADTLKLLSKAIEKTSASRVFLLGDLIHDRDSMTDELVEAFSAWRRRHADCQFVLVRGNHDRHVQEFPDSWKLEITVLIEKAPFHLQHEVSPTTLASNPAFQIGGHWHPVVTVGLGADRIRLPCFVVEDRQITLPAFGPFKGGLKQHRGGAKKFYAIGDGMIWAVR